MATEQVIGNCYGFLLLRWMCCCRVVTGYWLRMTDETKKGLLKPYAIGGAAWASIKRIMGQEPYRPYKDLIRQAYDPSDYVSFSSFIATALSTTTQLVLSLYIQLYVYLSISLSLFTRAIIGMASGSYDHFKRYYWPLRAFFRALVRRPSFSP